MLSGRYRLDSVIGRGGMGVVWAAHDELLTRDVAVKEVIWPPHFTESDQQTASRRAIREAQSAGRLAHVNVVRIYDILQEDGVPWIVMELLPYQSLRDLVRDEGPVTPGRAARIGLGVLAALRAAHAEGILHRDVKPANILVGPDGRVVLTDFGIARAVGEPTLTTAGALVGSPSYIPPERARGGQSAPAGDLWGLGACLYAAVEGHPPFERDTPIATLTAVVIDEPGEPVQAGPLWPVIQGLLRKDPGGRLDAAQAERMLREIADDSEAVRAGSDSPGARHVAEPGADTERAPSEPIGMPPIIAAPTAPETAESPRKPDAAETEAAEPDAAEAEAAEPEAAEPGTGPEAAEAGTGEAGTPPPTAAQPEAAQPKAAEPKAAEPAVADGAEAEPSISPATAAPVTAAHRRLRWSRRTALVTAGLSAVAAAVIATVFALISSPGRPAASTGTGSRSAGHPATSPASTPPASATPNPTSSGSGSSSGGGPAYGALPAGYYRFTNSTGFSIGVPRGWQIRHVGHYVYINDPSNGGIFLLIDQSDTPKPDPLADWQQQAANRTGTYPDYHLIRLASVDYPQAEKAADWEFTYARSGTLVHILNRNILANAHHAYALYWSTPASDWSANYHYFRAFADTFRPAAATS